MKIAVLGCGAMGSIYAALLSSAGHEVIAIDHHGAHIDAINSQGLRVSGASGDRTVSIRAFREPPTMVVDLLVIAVKGSHVSAAAESAQVLLNSRSLVLTIQNGLGSADAVANVIGPDRLIIGIAQGFGASMPAPGHAHHNDMKAIRMGAYGALDHLVVEQVAAIFKSSGFDAEATEDIEAMQWEKLICNVAYSAISALTGFTVGEINQDPIVGPLSRQAAVEAWHIAKARGVNIKVDDPVRLVQDFAMRMPAAKPSVLLDIEAGRISEVGMINGSVAVEAAKVGLTAPVNQTLTSLVQSLEQRRAQA